MHPCVNNLITKSLEGLCDNPYKCYLLAKACNYIIKLHIIKCV